MDNCVSGCLKDPLHSFRGIVGRVVSVRISRASLPIDMQSPSELSCCYRQGDPGSLCLLREDHPELQCKGKLGDLVHQLF